MTDGGVEALVAHLGRVLADGPRRADAIHDGQASLAAMLEHGELPATVAEIRDGDNQPIYRVTNVAGTQLHAWLERKGWESTGWTLASDFDDIEPVPGREDMARGSWPVGLAALISKALAELDTSELDTWGEP